MLLKKLFFTAFLMLIYPISLVAANSYAPEFVILITSYNNEKYAEANLASVCHQRSTKPYTIIYVNDGLRTEPAKLQNGIKCSTI